MSRGGARPGAGRPSSWGRGVRVQARTLRMPDEVWDQLEGLSLDLCLPPSLVVGTLIRQASDELAAHVASTQAT